MCTRILGAASIGAALLVSSAAGAADCPVDHEALTKALKDSVKPAGGPTNGGFDNNEWAAIVARDGTVCTITYSGKQVGDQWPASRAVAAEKAFTANGVSLPKFGVSTANLYAGGIPGGMIYGVITTNPPNPQLLYEGDAKSYGTPDDPMQGEVAGGVVGFGGGLPLYDENGIVGALGVSGDTSCADHNVAWRVREKLGLDKIPAGVTTENNDAIVYDMGSDGTSASGFGHPECGGSEVDVAQDIGASADDANPFSKGGEKKDSATRDSDPVNPGEDDETFIEEILPE